MKTTVVVRLASPATEMAREEIPKQIAFLSKDIEAIRFEDEGAASKDLLTGMMIDAPSARMSTTPTMVAPLRCRFL